MIATPGLLVRKSSLSVIEDVFANVSFSILEILASSAFVNVAAVAKAKVSVPAPPSTVSVTRAVVEELENSDSPVETLMISLPAPP